ncbi:MAG: hypothetical protein HY231_21390 [Acidobacteria bacterium]|nr:hypothetical protein [Acidobacteriota bacterium]
MKDKMMKVLLSLSVVFLLGVAVVANAGTNQADQMKPAEPAKTAAPQKAKAKKPKAKKAASMHMAGVPKGVQACLDHLVKMAEKDPLMAYEGRPEEIINGGLLWNDTKSRCSLGTDVELRKKAAAVADAWRKKDAAAVRSLLQELKSAAPQS